MKPPSTCLVVTELEIPETLSGGGGGGDAPSTDLLNHRPQAPVSRTGKAKSRLHGPLNPLWIYSAPRDGGRYVLRGGVASVGEMCDSRPTGQLPHMAKHSSAAFP